MASQETSHVKYTFGADMGEPVDTHILAHGIINGAGRHATDKPVTLVGDRLRGQIIIDHKGNILSAARHPNTIPSSIDLGQMTAEFGAPARTKHVEGSMIRTLGAEHIQKDAASITSSLKEQGLQKTSKAFTGLFGQGIETEGWTSGTLPVELQEELHSSLLETALPPSASVCTIAAQTATDILVRNETLPNLLHVMTSMPIDTPPWDLQLNTNPGPLGKYVAAYQQYLYSHYFTPHDEVSRKSWDSVARQLGEDNFDQLKQRVGDLRLWACAAAHTSTGLYHREQGNGYHTSTEEAIAHADTFNSDLATVAEWMMYSTPVVFGVRPAVVGADNSVMYPRDVRAVLKLGMATTYPAPFIETPGKLRKKIITSIGKGIADRLDRASYTCTIETPRGMVYAPCAHGRVRNRIAGQGNGFGPHEKITGRIEYTGCGASPDILAQASRNAYLTVLNIAVYEALAHGQSPRGYYASLTPSIATWDNQRELSHRYNFEGAIHHDVMHIIEQNKQLVDYINSHYSHQPDIAYVTQLAQWGLNRLSQKTEATTFDEFLNNPTGSISDVIARRFEAGVIPTTIAAEIDAFQVAQAQKVLSAGGDVLRLV